MPPLVAIAKASRSAGLRSASAWRMSVSLSPLRPYTIGRVEEVDARGETGANRGDAVGVVHIERGDARDGPGSECDGRDR